MGRQPPKGRDQAPDDDVPARVPDVPPHRYASHGHDFTLQAVMEMQRTLGELHAKSERASGDLNAKVDRLISDVKSLSDKVDKVCLRLAWVAGGAAVVGAIVALAVSALRFLPA